MRPDEEGDWVGGSRRGCRTREETGCCVFDVFFFDRNSRVNSWPKRRIRLCGDGGKVREKNQIENNNDGRAVEVGQPRWRV